MKERWEMINEINVLYNEISRLQCLLDNTLVKISEDCISRKQAIEEMSEALIVLCYDYNMEQDELVETIEEQVRACAQQILKSLPPVTPKVSEDCISREAAVEAFAREVRNDGR